MKLLATRVDQPKSLDPLVWLHESREQSKIVVYTPEVLQPIQAVYRGLMETVPKIALTEDYLKRAGQLAQVRAYLAAQRLAGVWQECLR